MLRWSTVFLCLLLCASGLHSAQGRRSLQQEAPAPAPGPDAAAAPSPAPFGFDADGALAVPAVMAPEAQPNDLSAALSAEGAAPAPSPAAAPDAAPAPAPTPAAAPEPEAEAAGLEPPTEQLVGEEPAAEQAPEEEQPASEDGEQPAEEEPAGEEQPAGDGTEPRQGDRELAGAGWEGQLTLQPGSLATIGDVPSVEGYEERWPVREQNVGTCNLYADPGVRCNDGMGDLDAFTDFDYKLLLDADMAANGQCGVTDLDARVEEILDWAYRGRWGGCDIVAYTVARFCVGQGAAEGTWRGRVMLWPDNPERCKPLCVKMRGTADSTTQFGRTASC